MKKIKIFIQLTRLNKPIGFMLLFWPCLWGLTLAYSLNLETNLYFKYLFLFFLGSVLMRSAGCIFNDIVDRNLDKKVTRTKKRPIASGMISVYESFFLLLVVKKKLMSVQHHIFLRTTPCNNFCKFCAVGTIFFRKVHKFKSCFVAKMVTK